jgi:putative transposase
VANIAFDSDGNNYSGSHLNKARHRHHALRGKLQKKGTKSAKRLLKKRRRKEQRFATNVNHTISKSVVALAERTGRGLALEDLDGIRDRVRAKKKPYAPWGRRSPRLATTTGRRRKPVRSRRWLPNS